MLIVIACIVLLVAAVVMCVAWGGERLRRAPDPVPFTLADTESDAPVHSRGDGVRVYLWWGTLVVLVGTATSVLVTGAGGRLIMRLLAITSPDAEGLVTEAQAVVGDITLSGTIAYLIFGALPTGLLSTVLYVVVAPWLPPGRLAGPTWGLVLLVVFGASVDPLRADNFDFALLEPGWLSVVSFSALAVLQGATVAALAGRLSRSLPLLSRQHWVAAAVALLVAIVLLPVGLVIAFGALIVLMFPDLLPGVLLARATRLGVRAGRVLLALVVLVTLPGFIVAVVSIWTE